MHFVRTTCRYTLIFAALLLVSSGDALAQQHRLIPLDHWAYDYIHRLQLRGHLLDLHPTALPYTEGAVTRALDDLDRDDLSGAQRRWARALRDAFGRAHRKTVVGAEIQPGVRISSSPRLDPLRPARDRDVTLDAGNLSIYPEAAARLFMAHGPVVAQVGVLFDVYYRDDPDGLEAANRLITRNEDAYAGIGSRFASLYIGRMGHHWSARREPALLVSDNPAQVDQIHLRMGGDRLALRSVVGELDSMTEDGRFTGTAGADSVSGSIRRYLSAHRIDWRPFRRLALTFMESSLYSARNAGFSLKFMNPLALHAFAVDGRPKNDENNGLLAGMLWAQFAQTTLQGQLLLDDFDVMNTSSEPPAIAASGSLTYAGLASADLGVQAVMVASRTYNAHQPDGRYTYLLRGVGTQFNDYVKAGAFATVYLSGGRLDASLTPRIDALFQGSAEIHQTYPTGPDEADFILDGTVQRVIRPAVEVRLQHGRSWWLHVDAGPAFITNEHNIEGNDRTAFTFTAGISARLSASDRIDL